MNKKQTHLAYGFITGLVTVVISAVLLVTKMNTNKYLSFIGFAVFLVGIIMNGIAFSKANNADVTFGQVFGSCFKATAIVALVSVAWAVISIFVFPNMVDENIDKARADMVAQGKMSEEQIEMAMGMTKKFFKPLMIGGAVFGTLLFGVIFSLIGAAVAKKNPQPVYQG